MTKPTLRDRLRTLLQPSASRSVLFLVAVGAALGVVGMVGFNYSMHVTSTDAFCVSCHEMYEHPYQQLQRTSHFNNVTGIQATCADCHLPQEFGPKMVRKIEAAREVWGSITGIIDTPEKYRAHLPVMKAREIARIKANDSQECRNCHDPERWLTAMQSVKAQQYHEVRQLNDKTCIDCHSGIAHPRALPNTAGTVPGVPHDELEGKRMPGAQAVATTHEDSGQ
ncbi:MAG: NapC/NirT family cytochrome c [Halioglobus sp.]|nr:NapC/NirT family cytochrome c [Halioglobus sp.]